MPRRLGRYLLVLILAWVLVAFRHDASYSTATALLGEGQRALLLTAHPDDECMFFAPTVLALVQNSVTLYSFCLSVGDADGLGDTREKELGESLRILGIPGERSQVINHPLLQDNFTQEWSAGVVAAVVMPFIFAHNITTIFTFDDLGISQHPNHISLPNGVAHLLRAPSAPPVQLFTLITVPLLHKYIGVISNPLAKLWVYLPWTSGDNQTYISGLAGYLTALRAMSQHRSQLVWFRWLYVLFSRYMWVNEWAEVQTHVEA